MNWQNSKGQVADGTQAVNDAVRDMLAHEHIDIVQFQNQAKLLFGFRCETCESHWTFRLLPFRKYGFASDFKDEMTTAEGRQALIGMCQGALVVRDERRR